MFGSAVLEVAIGIIFIFMLVSVVCSAIGNKISEYFKWRARDLEIGIRDYILQGNPGLLATLYRNPLIASLAPKDPPLTKALENTPLRRFIHPGEKPINIPPQTFVLGLFDALVPGSSGASTIDDLRNAITNNLPLNFPLRDSLLGLVTNGDQTIDNARTNVEQWFDSAMDQVSSMYKRDMWRLAIVIAFLVVVVLNIDSIAIADRLWRDPSLRATVVQAAQQYEQANNSSQALKELDKLNLPIGWEVDLNPFRIVPKDWESAAPEFSYLGGAALKALGWIITAIAGAQGAPFWFDLLKKLTQRS